MNFVLSSLSEGLLWSIMAIGVFLTFRILDIADMTAEGAFPLGAAVVASQIQAGRNPWIATLLGFFCRDDCRLGLWILHTKNENSSPLDRDCHFDGSLLYQYQNHWGVPNLSIGDASTIFKSVMKFGLSNEEAVFLISISA